MELFDYEKEHLQRVRGGLAECTVLLKCSGNFPLECPGKIAAYGNGVRHTIRGGTGSGEVNSRFFVTAEQGLNAAGFDITTGKWLDAYDAAYANARKAFIEEVKARAKAKHTLALIESMGAVMKEPEYDLALDGEGDTAVYVLSRNSGEGADREVIRGDILLTKTETRDILELHRKYRRFMLVLNVGGPVDLSPVACVEDILLLSQLGTETGSALADILLGHVNPSGKLTTTWTAWEDYCNIGEFGDINDTRYKEGIYVGYRYFDSIGKKAQYPFGYGLSYTSFTVMPGEISAEGEAVTVTAVVKNTGDMAGKEVVQVYVSSPEGRLDQPYQALAGFTKTRELAAGEEQKVRVSFRMSELSSYDTEASAYILERGSYIVRVGNSSADTVAAGVITLDKEAVTRKARACCGKPDFEDWKPGETTGAADIPEGVPVIAMKAEDLETVTVAYDKEWEIAPEIAALSDQELAYLNVGGFDSRAGTLSVIGTASKSVAGAAGETTDLLKAKGIPSLVMADGPAGLRITPAFYRDEKGAHGIGQGGIPESMLDFVSGPLKVLFRLIGGSGDKKKEAHRAEYQYAVAIPIGTALAQSFNLSFAEDCGDVVGDEMERFGVHLWLAPALNIHRNIRCGRNFEYFSEDPLISGRFAAALTRGVQKHPGCGTTIKHYAGNNQETNRMNNNSIVSERALREIYLKGFGICVRESQPHALMTSYNLLNGVHVSERRDMIEDILRCEYGFQGIVMTDWMVRFNMSSKESRHRKGLIPLIAAAGGDLIMPGSKADVKEILAGLKNGELSRKQLQINATRVYRKAKELHG